MPTHDSTEGPCPKVVEAHTHEEIDRALEEGHLVSIPPELLADYGAAEEGRLIDTMSYEEFNADWRVDRELSS